MKCFSVLILMLTLFEFSGIAQKPYLKENLEQMSTEDLNVLLKSAKSYKTAGIVGTMLGPFSIASILVLNETKGGISFETAGIIFTCGLVSTIVGIPTWIVNKSRIKRINTILDNRVSLKFSPYKFNNDPFSGSQYGFSLTLSF